MWLIRSINHVYWFGKVNLFVEKVLLNITITIITGSHYYSCEDTDGDAELVLCVVCLSIRYTWTFFSFRFVSLCYLWLYFPSTGCHSLSLIYHLSLVLHVVRKVDYIFTMWTFLELIFYITLLLYFTRVLCFFCGSEEMLAGDFTWSCFLRKQVHGILMKVSIHWQCLIKLEN